MLASGHLLRLQALKKSLTERAMINCHIDILNPLAPSFESHLMGGKSICVSLEWSSVIYHACFCLGSSLQGGLTRRTCFEP